LAFVNDYNALRATVKPRKLNDYKGLRGKVKATSAVSDHCSFDILKESAIQRQ
jgi:hypothetical protein